MTRADVGTLLDACVHCGLCLPACPTYGLAGSELDSPRGRIDFVRALAEGRLADEGVAARHLDRCLGCRACETACPSGVRYAEILAAGRGRVAGRIEAPPAVRMLLAGFASPARTTWAMRVAGLARLPVVGAAARAIPGSLGAAARVAPAATWTPWSRRVPEVLPAVPPRRGSVVLLPGCVMDQGFPDVHAASAALLRAAGFDVRVPRGPVCCGALHAHAGDEAGAAALGARLASAIPDDADAVVTDAAGCGSHLKGTDGPWRGRVADVLEFVDRHGLREPLAPVAHAFGRAGRLRVAWADPCHLAHGQGIREAPRRLLASVPDVDLVPLRDADRCCGSAGTWGLAHGEMSRVLLDAKVRSIRDAAPHVLATANPGCHLQIEAGLRDAGLDVPVVHAAEVLARALPPHAAG